MIEKANAENRAPAANIQRSLKLEFEDQLSKQKAYNTKETRANPLRNKDELATQPNVSPNNLENIMKETLIQQDRDKIDLINMETNVVLFNVPESSESSAEERIDYDINFFKTFCRKGLKSYFDFEIESAIRLERTPAGGEPAVKDKADGKNLPRPRPLKILLGSKYDKDETFKKLGNLRGAEMPYNSISVNTAQSKREIE